MALNCEVLPWPDASAHDLQRLGEAFSRWFSGYVDDLIEAGIEADSWVDMESVDSLLVGEQPRQFGSRCGLPGITVAEMVEAVTEARSRHTLVRRLLPPVESRAVLFGFSLPDEGAEAVVASLSLNLPMDLVAGVRINGVEYSPVL